MADWDDDDFRDYQESQRENQKGKKISKGAKIAGGILAGLGAVALGVALGGMGNHDENSYDDDGWES